VNGTVVATDRALRLAGLALPAAVWVLCVVPPPRGGLTAAYLAVLTALLGAMVLVDQTLPRAEAPAWRRLLWLAAELGLAFAVVQLHGTLVRPALVYLLPASRALLLFDGWRGVALSLSAWVVYTANVAAVHALEHGWADTPNYYSFFLGPFTLAVVLSWAVLRQAAESRRVQALYDALRVAHAELQALHARARQAAVTEERNRLAREIHDSVAHYLTVVNVQLEAAEKLAADQPARAFELVRRARRLTLESLQEARRSVQALRSSSLEQLSLPRALDKLAAEFGEATGLSVQLDVTVPEGEVIAPETSLALFRTAQEGLTNVQRHARASVVRLRLGRANGSLELAVEDDGVGPPPDVSSDAGFGLVGLRERLELLGGRLAFGPATPCGTRLAAVVPTTPPPAP
jgi:signal transduction histidine kinase